MTERVRVEHDFDCSQQQFWQTFLSADYNRAMFVDDMKFRRWEIVELIEEGDRVRRAVEVQPYVGELPAAIKKVIGDTVKYREEGTLDLSKHRYDLRVVPGILPGKIQVTGSQYTTELSEEKTRRIFEATVEVKVFGVGGLIEKQIASDMKKSYERGASFTQKYIKDHA